MQKLPTAVLATATLLGLPGLAHAATPPGSLDRTYGLDGTASSFTAPIPAAIDVLPDGSTASNGPIQATDPDAPTRYGLVRHAVDGRLVSSYGSAGLASVVIGPANGLGIARLATTGADGQAYVAGVPTTQGAAPAVTVQRLTAQGGPDAGFGLSGTATIPIPGGAGDPVPAGIALGADGAAVVSVADGGSIRVLRLTASGGLDPSFATGGIATLTTTSTNGYVSAPSVLADGSVLLTYDDDTGAGSTVRVAKLGPAGTLDATWGTAGVTDTQQLASPVDALAATPVVRPTGGVVLLAQATSSADPAPKVVALTASGALDTSFSGDGLAPLAFGATDAQTIAYGTAVQPNGAVLATEARITFDSDDPSPTPELNGSLRRLTSGGAVDAAFGEGGVVALPGQLPIAVAYVPVAGRAVVSTSTVGSGGFGSQSLRAVVANLPPVARITGPATATAGSPVTFDASSSSDDDGRIADSAWDLDGDGSFDDATGATATTTATSPGTLTVRVRVTDDQGTPGVASASVAVAQPPAGTTTSEQPPATTTTSEQPPATTTVTTTTPAAPVTIQVPVPVPVPAPPATGSSAGQAERTVVRPTLKTTRLTLDARGRVGLRLACPAGTTRCVGVVALRLGTRTIASGRYAIAPGRTATIRSTVQRSRRTAALRRRAKLAVRITPTGASPASRTVTLRRASR